MERTGVDLGVWEGGDSAQYYKRTKSIKDRKIKLYS